jgi:hypothetical protein
MSVIMIQDFPACSSPTLTYSDGIPALASHTTITESELMCDERIVLDYPLPEPAFPTAVSTETRLLGFEKTNTVPLCLRPPTKECSKRYHEEDARSVSNTPSPRAPQRDEEWVTWINWGECLGEEECVRAHVVVVPVVVRLVRKKHGRACKLGVCA